MGSVDLKSNLQKSYGHRTDSYDAFTTSGYMEEIKPKSILKRRN